MFGLAHLFAWLIGNFGRTRRVEREGDNRTTVEKSEGNETNCKSDRQIMQSDDTTLNDVDYELLRLSDSEDWDEDILTVQANFVEDISAEKASSPLSKHDSTVTYGGISLRQEQNSSGIYGFDVESMTKTRKNFVNTSHKDLSYSDEKYYKNEVSSYKGAAFCANTETQEQLLERHYQSPVRQTMAFDGCQVDGCQTINSSDFENMFDWNFMEKLTELETLFSSPEISMFLEALRKTLESASSPYSFLIYLVENYYSNFTEGKNSMAHIALTQFGKWRDEPPFSVSAPTEMHKDRALWIVTTRKIFLFDLCNQVFRLDSKGNEYLQRHVYYLLDSKKKYKEAVIIATKLHLQPCFQPIEVRGQLYEETWRGPSYVANCPWQQRAFVSMLDKLCVMTDESLESLASDVVSTKPSNCKITQASLTKLGERMVKKFHLDPDDFPELFRAKNIRGLSYLLHQRQKDKGRSTKKWDDLIERCVGNSQFLQQSLVELLTDFGDLDEARRWARCYQLPCEQDANFLENVEDFEVETKEDWENEMMNIEDTFSGLNVNNSCGDRQPEGRLESPYSPRPTFLELDIPLKKIFFVDDCESLRYCQRAVSKPGVTVGFDAEWKPQLCQAGSPQRLSIVQLALRNEVFILDLIALADDVVESSLLAFGNALFANEKVLKLGYGVECDFKALVATLPVMEKVIKKMKRFVDLCILSQELFEMPVMKKKIEKTTHSLTTFGHLSEKGLSLLVQQCLGLPLDKTFQLSDWEQRPLLEKQVTYAALDARCLIDVFDVLSKWMTEEKIEIDLNEFSPRLPWLFPKRSRRTKAKLGRQPKPGSSNFDLQRLNAPAVVGSPNSPRNFRVVVDNMLQGLGRYLRCCGVDVVILANEDDHDKAAKIARREGRVILTTGTPYYTLRSQVPLGSCMCVPAGNAKEQVMAVFKHFNVSVSTSDIFSRCQVCNGNEYITVSSLLMRQAYINYYESQCEKNKMHRTGNSVTAAGDRSLPLNVETLTLRSGVRLQIEVLPESILDKIKLFYCCATCGKIFWEGGHFTRICTQFSDVLNRTESFYENQRPYFASRDDSR